MPYGSGPLIRAAFARANPWQRYLICVVMVAGGAALVLLGHVAGGLLSVAGIVLFVRMIRLRNKSAPRPVRQSAAQERFDGGTAEP